MSYATGVLFVLETVKKRQSRKQLYFFDSHESRIDYIKNFLGKTEKISKTWIKHFSEIKEEIKIITTATKANLRSISLDDYHLFHSIERQKWSKVLELDGVK